MIVTLRKAIGPLVCQSACLSNSEIYNINMDYIHQTHRDIIMGRWSPIHKDIYSLYSWIGKLPSSFTFDVYQNIYNIV